jgi:hypothetical protein
MILKGNDVQARSFAGFEARCPEPGRSRKDRKTLSHWENVFSSPKIRLTGRHCQTEMPMFVIL